MAPSLKGLSVAEWITLLLGASLIGASVAYAMAVPQRWLPLPGLCGAAGAFIAIRSIGVLISWQQPGSSAMAVVLSGVGLSAGYWLASASLLLSARPGSAAPQEHPQLPATSSSTAIVLSFAAPERYRISRAARHIRQLIESEALTIPTSALPFVFLSERARYRAIGGFLPARASVIATAEQMEGLLSPHGFDCVHVVFGDGPRTLRQTVTAAREAGARTTVLVTLGPDGSLPTREVLRELESPDESGNACPDVTLAPSIWYSEELAGRLVSRILDTTRGVLPDEVGVALIGEGQPSAWMSFDHGWRERENYFNQRVRLLLTEHGVRAENIRSAWLEWQTPDVTEAVRHLAALGCTRIVVAPSTIPCVALATALDLEHMVDLARVGENVRTVTLPPWGDDPAFAAAAAAVILRATKPE